MIASGEKPSPTKARLLIACLSVLGCLSVLQCLIAEPGSRDERGFGMDCDFPGGNIVVDAVERDTVSIHQNLRDTQGDWFYWYFRVCGAAGRTLTFRFTRGNVIGVQGPAVSTDGGKSWKWLGRSAVKDASFSYSFAPEAGEVRFCFAMPYLESNLHDFIWRHVGNPHLGIGVLCKTRKGRDVEFLRLGRLDGKCDHRVLMTCRHHACESMAGYSLEGIMEAVLGEGDDGKWFREHVEFLVVPLMDKDGVEEGDQGKNRKPHDHNRDYWEESIYPSVRTLKRIVPEWSGGRLRFALDMHCPWIRGAHNEEIYFVGTPKEGNWQQVKRFSRILETVQTGPLVFSSANDLPFGKAWNTDAGPPRSFARWAESLPGVLVATTIEIPYANASGKPVTTEAARAFGHDLARALRHFLTGVKGEAGTRRHFLARRRIATDRLSSLFSHYRFTVRADGRTDVSLQTPRILRQGLRDHAVRRSTSKNSRGAS